MKSSVFFVVLLTFWSTPASADMIVVNGRYAWHDSSLELHAYQNSGCRVIFDFRHENRSDGLFACEGEWNWDSIEKTTSYFVNRVNVDKNVNYFNVMEQYPNQCIKLDDVVGAC